MEQSFIPLLLVVFLAFLVPILLVAAFAIKILSALVFRFAYSWRESLSGGMLLSARLSLIIAASAIGVRLGAITESTNAAIILIAALTAMFAPLGFNILMASPDEKKKLAMLIYGDRDLAFQVGITFCSWRRTLKVQALSGNRALRLLGSMGAWHL